MLIANKVALPGVGLKSVGEKSLRVQHMEMNTCKRLLKLFQIVAKRNKVLPSSSELSVGYKDSR